MERGRSFLEMPAPLPPDGRQVWYFPGAGDHGHADRIARVHRRDGTWWTACLAASGPQSTPEADAFVMPCGERVYLSGGVADRDEPASWRALAMRRFHRAIWSPDRRFVVFCDGLSLEVFGPAGPLWQVREIGEVAVEAVAGDAVTCSLYDPATGEDVERRFETASGRLL